jgi:hypothetical protein
MDEVSKILTPTKPSKMCKFSPISLRKILSQYPLEIKDADRLNPSETTLNVVTLQKNPSIGGGAGWTLNRMAHSVLPLT